MALHNLQENKGSFTIVIKWYLGFECDNYLIFEVATDNSTAWSKER